MAKAISFSYEKSDFRQVDFGAGNGRNGLGAA